MSKHLSPIDCIALLVDILWVVLSLVDQLKYPGMFRFLENTVILLVGFPAMALATLLILQLQGIIDSMVRWYKFVAVEWGFLLAASLLVGTYLWLCR